MDATAVRRSNGGTDLGRPSRFPCALARCRASLDPFGDPRPLEFRDRAKDVHLELAGRRCGVDALVQRHERDAERRELLQHREQVPKVAAEAIEAPYHDHVESAPPRLRQQMIERWPPILCAAHAAVDVVDGVPRSRLDIATKFLKLVFRFLIERGNTSVNGSAHGNLLWSSGSPRMSGTRLESCERATSTRRNDSRQLKQTMSTPGGDTHVVTDLLADRHTFDCPADGRRCRAGVQHRLLICDRDSK